MSIVFFSLIKVDLELVCASVIVSGILSKFAPCGILLSAQPSSVRQQLSR